MGQKFNLGFKPGDFSTVPYPKGVRNKQVSDQIEVIDGQALALIFRRFALLLQENEQLLNDLNVFPVPDSDTGTNALLTVQSGVQHIDKGKKDASVVAAHMAMDAGANARGNSGVILAEFLRGFAEDAPKEFTVSSLRDSIQSAAQFARLAVASPSEGTILTVADVLSDVNEAQSIADYAQDLSKRAREAVQRSTSQLPELTAAGVVDAGALALSFLFDAIHEVVNGVKVKTIELAQTSCDVHSIDYRGPEFEVMFNFSGDALSLREELSVLGESLTVTGPANNARFHIHVDNATEVILEAMRHGMASKIVINNLISSHAEQEVLSDGTGVVIALDGPGLTKQAIDLSAQVVSSASDVPVAEFESAIRATNQQNVIVLPSALDNHAAASISAHRLQAEGLRVSVIPTRTIPHSLAALAVFRTDADYAANVESMQRAAETTRSGCVLTSASGAVEGYIDGLLFDSSHETSAEDMLTHVIDALLNDGGELVTVLVGAEGQMTHIHLMADHVGVDFDFISGGQTSSVYLVGVE